MIASHNSWTYLPPVKRWMWLLAPFAKCQNKTIEEQIKAGVEVLDLRLKLYNETMKVAHGGYIVNAPFFGDLFYHPKYCRVLLESRNPSAEEIAKFKKFCKFMEINNPITIFYGGHGAHKPNWRTQYYNFGTTGPHLEEYHASVKGGLIPYLWAWKNNKHRPADNVMYDFVGNFKV